EPVDGRADGHLARLGVDDEERVVAQAAAHRHRLRRCRGGAAEQHRGDGAHRDQSRKLVKDNGCSAISLRMSAIAACSSSRLAPLTRTVSPWIDDCTFSLLCLIVVCSFFAVSASMPLLTASSWRTLSPPIFSTFAVRSRKRAS